MPLPGVGRVAVYPTHALFVHAFNSHLRGFVVQCLEWQYAIVDDLLHHEGRDQALHAWQ